MRRGLLLLFVAGFVLSVAGPALAKGPEEGGVTAESVSIRGSGVSVRLTGGDAASYGDLSNTFIATSRMTGQPVNVDLGPRYEVAYWITCEVPNGPSAFVVINQSLFPYARYRSLPQVWTFTPPGQPGCGFLQSPAPGWVASRRGLVDVLTAAGIPASLPGAAPQQPLSVPQGGLSPVWFILGAAGSLTLLLAATVAGRSRARASL